MLGEDTSGGARAALMNNISPKAVTAPPAIVKYSISAVSYTHLTLPTN